MSVSIQQPDGSFRILSPAGQLHPLTNDGWRRFAYRQERDTVQRNAMQRRHLNARQADYWRTRHQLAARHVNRLDPIPTPTGSNPAHAFNPIDHFVNAKLEANSLPPAHLTDDLAFLRRLALDTVGQIPTTREIQVFLDEPTDQRRANAIERYLDDPRWADHWTAYWQDVL
ncbi:MAG: DUF1549 domain-containing protein, partial [Planctomycetota bacterium]